MTKWTWTALASGLLGVTGCFSTAQVKAPKGDKLEVARGAFPHGVLDAVLKKYVDARGRVDYRGLAADRHDLERYLVAIAEVSPDSAPRLFPTPAHELAYWINAYNAYVLYAVTERPDMRSVGDQKIRFFYLSEYVVGGRAISLYHLENDIVRERYDEPRIHFALNCASWGCPELPAEAFTPERLEAQLDRESRAFCAHPEKVHFGPGTVQTPQVTSTLSAKDGASVVRLSQIFEWYADDFEDGPVAFCRAHGRDDIPADAEIRFLEYDWTLNAQPGRALFE